MRSADEALLLEQHAERAALSRVWGVNFTHILTRRGIAPEISVHAPAKSRRLAAGAHQNGADLHSLPLRGADLYDERVWQKFLSKLEPVVDLTNLSDGADLLSQKYTTWLLTKYTGRSRLVESGEHLAWVEQVASLVVLRRMMEAKYHLHLSSERGFADPWAAHVMESLLFTALMTGETAKAVHRACREPEQARSYIDAIKEKLEEFLSDRPQVLRSDLPRLPQSTSLPQILISKQAHEPHEEKDA